MVVPCWICLTVFVSVAVSFSSSQIRKCHYKATGWHVVFVIDISLILIHFLLLTSFVPHFLYVM